MAGKARPHYCGPLFPVCFAGVDEVLGARGGHARAAVGVAELPRGAAVEVELIAAVRP